MPLAPIFRPLFVTVILRCRPVACYYVGPHLVMNAIARTHPGQRHAPFVIPACRVGVSHPQLELKGSGFRPLSPHLLGSVP